MKSLPILRSVFLLVLGAACASWVLVVGASAGGEVKQTRQAPRVIDPGSADRAPSDAIVLFDGTGLSEWEGPGHSTPRWKVEDGILTVEKRTGDLFTKRKLGDIQLHLEWRIPVGEGKKGESSGNSGIKFHTAYEVQILNSYQNKSNPMGQAGAVYKQHAPLVNACLKPGEWQSYDIVFRAPYWDDEGKLAKRGTLTVLHNGVLVQDKAPILGRTNSNKPVSKETKQAFFLQSHGSAVSFRNIWVRELEREGL